MFRRPQGTEPHRGTTTYVGLANGSEGSCKGGKSCRLVMLADLAWPLTPRVLPPVVCGRSEGLVELGRLLKEEQKNARPKINTIEHKIVP